MPRAEHAARLHALALVRLLALASLVLPFACARPLDPRALNHPLLGKPAPTLALTAIDDAAHPRKGGAGPRVVSLRALRGDVIVVSFFAKWCDPCKKTLPAMDALATKYAAKKVAVVGISEDDDPRGLAEFADSYDVSFPIAWDPGRDSVRLWGVPMLPAEFIIDRAGVVRGAFIGYAEGVEIEIERAVIALL